MNQAVACSTCGSEPDQVDRCPECGENLAGDENTTDGEEALVRYTTRPCCPCWHVLPESAAECRHYRPPARPSRPHEQTTIWFIADSKSGYTVEFAAPHGLTDGDETTLSVTDYDDVGSMYILELFAGMTRSVGKQLVTAVSETE